MPAVKRVGNLVATARFRTSSLAELGAILKRDSAKLELYRDDKYTQDARFSAGTQGDVERACRLARTAIYTVLGLRYRTWRADRYSRDWNVYDIARASRNFPSDAGLIELDRQLHRVAPGITFSLAQYSTDGGGMMRSPDIVCFPVKHLSIYFEADVRTAQGGGGLISARAVGYTGFDSMFQNTIVSGESVWNAMWCEDKQVVSFIAYVAYYVRLITTFESVRDCPDRNVRESVLTTLRRMFKKYRDDSVAWPRFRVVPTTGISIVLEAPDVVLIGKYDDTEFSFNYNTGSDCVKGSVALDKADTFLQAFQGLHRKQDI